MVPSDSLEGVGTLMSTISSAKRLFNMSVRLTPVTTQAVTWEGDVQYTQNQYHSKMTATIKQSFIEVSIFVPQCLKIL